MGYCLWMGGKDASMLISKAVAAGANTHSTQPEFCPRRTDWPQ